MEQTFGYRLLADFAWLRDLQSVDPEAALAVCARVYPALMADRPSVDTSNYAAAASLALLRLQAGDKAFFERPQPQNRGLRHKA